MTTTNYFQTFICVADDCAAAAGEVPPDGGEKPTVARLQYDMVIGHPYAYTSDDVLFAVHAARHGIPESDMAEQRQAFFAKSQACLRSSPLAKRYGWGIHFDEAGKIALYGRETADYQQRAADPNLKQLKAMRSKRA